MKIISNKKYKDLIYFENEFGKIQKKFFEIKKAFDSLNDAIILINKQNKELQYKLKIKEMQRRQNASKIEGLTKQLNDLRRKNEKNYRKQNL